MVAINARAMIVSLPTFTEVFHTNISLIRGMPSEQIESPRSWGASPEIFLSAFSHAIHVINSFAILSIVFSAIRGDNKD